MKCAICRVVWSDTRNGSSSHSRSPDLEPDSKNKQRSFPPSRSVSVQTVKQLLETDVIEIPEAPLHTFPVSPRNLYLQ